MNEGRSHVDNLGALAPDMKHVTICYIFLNYCQKLVEECLGALHDLSFKFLLT